MKKFKNLRTGLIEEVFNEKVIEQMTKHTEMYEEVTDKENTSKKNTKKEEVQKNPEQTKKNEEVTDKAE